MSRTTLPRKLTFSFLFRSPAACHTYSVLLCNPYDAFCLYMKSALQFILPASPPACIFKNASGRRSSGASYFPGQTGRLLLSTLLKNQNLADSRIHIPLSGCTQLISLQTHRDSVLSQLSEKSLLQTAVCKNRCKSDNHLFSPYRWIRSTKRILSGFI